LNSELKELLLELSNLPKKLKQELKQELIEELHQTQNTQHTINSQPNLHISSNKFDVDLKNSMNLNSTTQNDTRNLFSNKAHVNSVHLNHLNQSNEKNENKLNLDELNANVKFGSPDKLLPSNQYSFRSNQSKARNNYFSSL